MKYITYVIMAVLIFGVATAPVFSNGTVFAQESTDKTEKEKKEQRSDESKQQKAQQAADAEERKQTSTEKKEVSKDKNTAAQELQEQRRAALEERNRLLMEKLAEEEKIDRKRMQERFDAMNDRSPMKEAMDRLADADVLDDVDSSVLDDVDSSVLDDVDSSDASIDTTAYLGNVGSSGSLTLEKALELQRQRITPDKTGTYFDQLRDTISEQKRTQDILFSQITLLLNLVDSMCEDKIIVAGISDGKLRCVDSDRAFNMHSRGLVTLVE